MAITSSSFRRFNRDRGPVLGGMRVVTPKVTGNLLKSVDAINKNLISINKLLSQEASNKVRQQQVQQTETARKAENLRRSGVESALEAPKKIAGFIQGAIAKPAKAIFGTIKQFLDPFIKFFTLTFVGWFTSGLIQWFQQNKETKKKQLEQFVPKVLTALTVAGGVLLAIQVGIPVIMGILGTIVSTLPILMGALLNPATWIVLLGVGTGILLFEGIEAVGDILDPGLRAQRRIRNTALQGRQNIFDPTKGLKYEQGESYSKPGTQGSTENYQYLDLGGNRYIRSDQIEGLMDNYFEKFTVYEKTGSRKFKTIGQQTFTPESFTANQSQNVQRLGFYQKANKLASFYKNYVNDRNRVGTLKSQMEMDDKKYQDYVARVTAGGKTVDELLKVDPTLRSLKADMERSKRKYDQALGTFDRTQNTMRTLYDRLPDQARRYLENDLGITRQNIYDPTVLESGQTEYALGRFGRAIMGQIANNSFIQGMQGQIDSIKNNVSSFVDTGIDFVANIQVQPDYQEGSGNDPADIGSPSNINPFNIEDPFLQHARKVYNAWGVI
jgi:hypothetical protein